MGQKAIIIRCRHPRLVRRGRAGHHRPRAVQRSLLAGTSAQTRPRPYAPPWKKHLINQGVSSHDVVIGDGKVDVAASGGLFLRKNLDSGMAVGKPQIERGAEGTALGALTGDRDLDLLAPSPDKPYRLSWFETSRHRGDEPAEGDRTRSDAGPGHNQVAIAVADVNADQRPDVIMAPTYGTGGLVRFEAPRDPRHGVWVRHVIDPSIQRVHQGSRQAAGFNGYGRADPAFAEQEQSPTRRAGVFDSLDTQGLHWQRQILTNKESHNLKVDRIGHNRLPSIA